MDERLKTPKNGHFRTTLKIDAPRKEPPFRERLRGDEQKGLTTLYGCDLFMQDALRLLGRRMEKMGVLWRYKGLLKQFYNLMHEVQDTAEPEQIASIAARARHTHGYIGIERAADPKDATYVVVDDLNVLCRTILDDTCGLCTRTGKEAASCPIQKALRGCTTLMRGKCIDGCMFKEYSDSGRLGLLDEGEDLIV